MKKIVLFIILYFFCGIAFCGIAQNVHFESNGGGPIGSLTVQQGEKIPKPHDPIKSGLTFNEWWTDPLFDSGMWIFEFQVLTQPTLTLYAQWLADVTFNSQGGSSVAPILRVIEKRLITEPTKPTKPGLTFSGWYTDAQCTDGYNWDFTTSLVTQNMTLYAKWTADVTFDSQGGSTVAAITDVLNQSIHEPIDPTKTGHIFGGWYTDLSYNTTWNFTTSLVTQNMTLYAKWDPISYTITLPVRQNFQITGAGNEIITRLDTSIMFGNVFVFKIEPEAGYNQSTPVVKVGTAQLTPDIYGFYRIDPVTQDSAITVMGIVINEYTVSFDSQGSTTISPVTNVPHGSTISPPDVPTKTGHTFDGWYTDSQYTTVWDFGSGIVVQDMILYAKWVEIITDPDLPDPIISRAVYITTIEGATIKEYLPGAYQITSGDDFTFTLVPGGANAHLIPVLKTNRKLTGGEEVLGVTWECVKNADGSYTITIKRIQETVTVSIEFVKDDTSNEVTTGTRVWAANGNVYMTATHNGNATIYNISGSLVATIPVRAGETSSIPLASGYYVVVLNGTTYKILTGK